MLLLAGPAAAHVVASPAFLPSRGSESIGFEAPNERSEPMTSFTLTPPDGVLIEHVHPLDGWNAGLVDGTTARWSGGSLPPSSTATFGVTLKAEVDPGLVTLQAKQNYDSGAVVEWPVELTVTPAEESPSQNLALAGIVGLVGVLVVVGILVLALRRRPASGGPRDRA